MQTHGVIRNNSKLNEAFVNENKKLAKKFVADFNSKLKETINAFTDKHPEIQVKLYDFNKASKALRDKYSKKKEYNVSDAGMEFVAGYNDPQCYKEVFEKIAAARDKADKEQAPYVTPVANGDLTPEDVKVKANYNEGCDKEKIKNYLWCDSYHYGKDAHIDIAEELLKEVEAFE